jgi:hypothetical protein
MIIGIGVSVCYNAFYDVDISVMGSDCGNRSGLRIAHVRKTHR